VTLQLEGVKTEAVWLELREFTETDHMIGTEAMQIPRRRNANPLSAGACDGRTLYMK
jgi:hypothetical protein